MAKREHRQYPHDIRVECKFGALYFNVTNARHIYVDASGNGKSLSYRGKQYAVSLHLEPLIDGWGPTRNDKRLLEESQTAFWCRRFQCYSSDDSAPPTHAQALKDEIIRVVREWVAANPEVLLRAQLAHTNNQLLAAEKEVEIARAHLKACEDVEMDAQLWFVRAVEALDQSPLPTSQPAQQEAIVERLELQIEAGAALAAHDNCQDARMRAAQNKKAADRAFKKLTGEDPQ